MMSNSVIGKLSTVCFMVGVVVVSMWSAGFGGVAQAQTGNDDVSISGYEGVAGEMPVCGWRSDCDISPIFNGNSSSYKIVDRILTIENNTYFTTDTGVPYEGNGSGVEDRDAIDKAYREFGFSNSFEDTYMSDKEFTKKYGEAAKQSRHVGMNYYSGDYRGDRMLGIPKSDPSAEPTIYDHTDHDLLPFGTVWYEPKKSSDPKNIKRRKIEHLPSTSYIKNIDDNGLTLNFTYANPFPLRDVDLYPDDSVYGLVVHVMDDKNRLHAVTIKFKMVNPGVPWATEYSELGKVELKKGWYTQLSSPRNQAGYGDDLRNLVPLMNIDVEGADVITLLNRKIGSTNGYGSNLNLPEGSSHATSWTNSPMFRWFVSEKWSSGGAEARLHGIPVSFVGETPRFLIKNIGSFTDLRKATITIDQSDIPLEIDKVYAYNGKIGDKKLVGDDAVIDDKKYSYRYAVDVHALSPISRIGAYSFTLKIVESDGTVSYIPFVHFVEQREVSRLTLKDGVYGPNTFEHVGPFRDGEEIEIPLNATQVENISDDLFLVISRKAYYDNEKDLLFHHVGLDNQDEIDALAKKSNYNEAPSLSITDVDVTSCRFYTNSKFLGDSVGANQYCTNKYNETFVLDRDKWVLKGTLPAGAYSVQVYGWRKAVDPSGWLEKLSKIDAYRLNNRVMYSSKSFDKDTFADNFLSGADLGTNLFRDAEPIRTTYDKYSGRPVLLPLLTSRVSYNDFNNTQDYSPTYRDSHDDIGFDGGFYRYFNISVMKPNNGIEFRVLGTRQPKLEVETPAAAFTDKSFIVKVKSDNLRNLKSIKQVSRDDRGGVWGHYTDLFLKTPDGGFEKLDTNPWNGWVGPISSGYSGDRDAEGTVNFYNKRDVLKLINKYGYDYIYDNTYAVVDKKKDTYKFELSVMDVESQKVTSFVGDAYTPKTGPVVSLVKPFNEHNLLKPNVVYKATFSVDYDSQSGFDESGLAAKVGKVDGDYSWDCGSEVVVDSARSKRECVLSMTVDPQHELKSSLATSRSYGYSDMTLTVVASDKQHRVSDPFLTDLTLDVFTPIVRMEKAAQLMGYFTFTAERCVSEIFNVYYDKALGLEEPGLAFGGLGHPDLYKGSDDEFMVDCGDEVAADHELNVFGEWTSVVKPSEFVMRKCRASMLFKDGDEYRSKTGGKSYIYGTASSDGYKSNDDGHHIKVVGLSGPRAEVLVPFKPVVNLGEESRGVYRVYPGEGRKLMEDYRSWSSKKMGANGVGINDVYNNGKPVCGEPGVDGDGFSFVDCEVVFPGLSEVGVFDINVTLATNKYELIGVPPGLVKVVASGAPVGVPKPVSPTSTCWKSAPTTGPTVTPTTSPTATPTTSPTATPTTSPTATPTTSPTVAPTTSPTVTPTTKPKPAPSSGGHWEQVNKPTNKPKPEPKPEPKLVRISSNPQKDDPIDFAKDDGDMIILATRKTAADALASGLPQSYLDAHLQLIDPTTYELSHLYHKNQVLILGGERAIPDSVKRDFEDNGIPVSRIGGATRVETSVKIAERFAGKHPSKVVLVDSTDTMFADALVAASYGARTDTAVLINRRDGDQMVHPAVAGYLARFKPGMVVVVGGVQSHPYMMEDEVRRLTSGETMRVAGDTRVETSVLLDELAPASSGEVLVVPGYGRFAWQHALQYALYTKHNGSGLRLYANKIKME